VNSSDTPAIGLLDVGAYEGKFSMARLLFRSCYFVQSIYRLYLWSVRFISGQCLFGYNEYSFQVHFSAALACFP